MKTIFEQQGVEYRQAGDYMLPNTYPQMNIQKL